MNFIGAHVFGVAFVVKEDEAFDPVVVGLFGAVGVVLKADGVGDLVEEFAWGFLFHSVLTFERGVCIVLSLDFNSFCLKSQAVWGVRRKE